MVFDRVMNQAVGQILNMSISGVMMISEDPVELPCIFSCRVKLPKKISGSDQLEFDAQAKWSRFNSLTGTYQTGYKFINLTPESERLIQKLLETEYSTNTDLLHPREFQLRSNL